MRQTIVLKITKGRLKGQEYSFDHKESILIGRQSDCAIVLPDDRISRHHCELEIDPPFVRVRDLSSMNGTYLNNVLIGRHTRGSLIEQSEKTTPVFAEMKDGDQLYIGGCELTLSSPLVGDEQEWKIERYQKLSFIGRGGMGHVWRALDTQTGKECALKIIDMRGLLSEDDTAKFRRESHLARQLDHPNIVRILDSGDAGHLHYIAQELCVGGSADDLMKRNGGSLSVEAATHIILQTLDALSYVHHAKLKYEDGRSAAGFVHRDIKPGNILLADLLEKPIAKIGDFGLSKLYELTRSTNPKVFTDPTATGEFAGAPEFTSCAQIMHYKRAKPEVDVWAAAATYYYMLTGQPPKNLTNGEKWQLALIEKAVPIQKRNPNIPDRLAAVIDGALTEEPEIGCKSASELRVRIEAAL